MSMKNYYYLSAIIQRKHGKRERKAEKCLGLDVTKG